MALNIDPLRTLRSDSQLRALIRAAMDAHPSDEQHFVEWKATLSLGKTGKEGHFSIAKCVLAMANRPVESATNYFGGCGYMIIGAEPGQLHDIDVPDMADLEPWVQRYTGTNGPTWSGHPVRVDNATVLVIIVEPPHDGDPIFPLMRTWAPDDKAKKSHQAGTIFVRHQARSEPATPADLDALQQRLLAAHTGPIRIDGVTAIANRADAVQVVDIDETSLEAAVSAERDILVFPAEQPAPAGLARGFQLGGTNQQDALDAYSTERERYMASFERALPAHTLHTALARREGLLRLKVTNTSPQPLQDVRIRIGLPDEILAFEEASQIDGRLPKRPAPPTGMLPLGTLAALGMLAQSPFVEQPDFGLMQKNISVSEDGSEVVFTIPSLHPSESADTDSFILLAPTTRAQPDADMHGVHTASLVISAGNRSNVSEGTVSFATTGTSWSVTDLISR
ncbi:MULTISPECIES: hypothetical protein [Cryobacterium]|uniref:hypothetical protein n=1 Tax=Cryobacterium TaxID=69578 RepID=UPI000CD3E808|nr:MULTISPECIES: hypothetical protein [Cryobacterium]POH66090.1 hypothetical protein C3B60_09715 [Cryobacterium zongtaii]TFC46757.1 hypothetical protein E3O57_05855 [Cryobacterium sp. TMN-39-2]